MTAQFNDDTHTGTVRFITQIGDAVYAFLFYQLCDLLDQSCFINQEWDLGYYDTALAVGHGLNGGHSTDADLAATGAIGLLDAGFA